MIFQGIRTSIAKEPYSFVIFQAEGGGGGGGGALDPSPRQDPRMSIQYNWLNQTADRVETVDQSILKHVDQYHHRFKTHSHVELPIDVASLSRLITCQIHMLTSNLWYYSIDWPFLI